MDKDVQKLLKTLGITPEELASLQKKEKSKKVKAKVKVTDDFDLIKLPNPYIIYRVELCKICKAKLVKIFHMRPNMRNSALVSVPISEKSLSNPEYKELEIKKQFVMVNSCDYCELYLHTVDKADLIHMVLYMAANEGRRYNAVN